MSRISKSQLILDKLDKIETKINNIINYLNKNKKQDSKPMESKEVKITSFVEKTFGDTVYKIEKDNAYILVGEKEIDDFIKVLNFDKFSDLTDSPVVSGPFTTYYYNSLDYFTIIRKGKLLKFIINGLYSFQMECLRNYFQNIKQQRRS